jgi:hypothetical protein
VVVKGIFDWKQQVVGTALRTAGCREWKKLVSKEYEIVELPMLMKG